jgi:N-acetylneuraminic acid mutarotase
MLSDAAIHARVEDYLEKSDALGRWWGRPITSEQLQAELNRMARGSRDPSMLKELFAALRGDPFVIAETLARESLADRRARNWYANDSRLHSSTRAKAEAATASCSDVECLKAFGGLYRETSLRLEQDPGDPKAEPGIGTIAFSSPQEFADQLERLAASIGGTSRAITRHKLSPLEETNDALAVRVVLSQKADELVTASVTWPKRSFDDWWAENRLPSVAGDRDSSFTFTLPAIATNACVNDSWTSMFSVVKRDGASAVWTGAEMVLWSGITGARYDPATDTWGGIASGGAAPQGQSNYSTVWTGTEMIIWGGAVISTQLNSGSRYNPTTNAWTPVSAGPNVPLSRQDHTAVWTGTEMVVWGGVRRPQGLLTFLNSGGRYNPSTDTWTPTSAGPNVPSARKYHTAIWTDSEMIVWGGTTGVGSLNTGGRYNPSTDTWLSTSTSAGVPSARQQHTAVWTGTEMIVWGAGSNTGGRYRPTSDSWAPTSTDPGVPTPRVLSTAVWTGTEMIVWGGYLDFGGGNRSYDPVGGRYDPVLDAWKPTSAGGNAPTGRFGHACVWTGTEMIVWGGANGSGDLNSGSRYDPSTDSWIPTSASGNVPAPRTGHAAVWTGAELIIWGGYYSDTSGSKLFGDGSRYCPATDRWTLVSSGPNAPVPVWQHTAVWTGTEMIVWGGVNSLSWSNAGGRYNPTNDSWSPTPLSGAVPSPRQFHTAVWTGREMLVWGGYGPGGYLNDGGRYDPSADAWHPTSTAQDDPAPRASHVAVWTGTEMVVWGGYALVGSNDDVFTSGGRYNPSSDTWVPTSMGPNTPSTRTNTSAVWTGTEMIIWGGFASGYVELNDGSRFDPTTDSWQPTSTGAGVPQGRDGHSATWTGAEMVVWGGDTDGGNAINTGGRYNPVTDAWTATSTGNNVLPGTRGHTASWTGTEILIWGGSTLYGDTNQGSRYCACPNGRLVYRDADGDGHGDPSTPTASSCDGTVPAGYSVDASDCNDADPNNWMSCATCVDADGDGSFIGCDRYLTITGPDCDDNNPAIFPNAPERNDGIDNQCPGDVGFGDVDEISGNSGFSDPGDKSRFAWPDQIGATAYDVVRSSAADFSAVCTFWTTADSFIVDDELPEPGVVFFYLVRSATPFQGSWGQQSDGSPRTIACSGPIAP